jgi:hypothetical protein
LIGRRFFVFIISLSFLISACTFSPGEKDGDGADPETNVIHQVSEAEVAKPEAVTSVGEIGWEWRPGEGESASDVHAGPAGAVIKLGDGLVGLKGDTGEELWRYQIPDAQTVPASFSPSGDQVLVASSDVPGVVLDTVTGSVVAENIDWDGSGRLLDDARLLHRQGEPEEALFKVQDLESGEILWQQETPETCSEGGPSRLISVLTSSEAVVLWLHCSEDISEEAVWEPEPGTVNALVALDPANGQELWRQESENVDGLGQASATMLHGAVIADFPSQDGWLIIDPGSGDTIAESPKPVLAVGETHYLAGPDFLAEDSTHELRTFEDEVSSSVTLPERFLSKSASAPAIGLAEQLVTIDMERGSPEDAINAIVTPWSEESTNTVISATTTGQANITDPGSLLSVPGAVLVYVPVDHSGNIDSLEHVVALR